MQSALETLSPTRVRLTVEVPFEELKPNLDSAYRKIGRQVRVQGFRPGKVPARILDQRVGRGVVLEEAVQEAVPKFYGDAVRANDVQVLGHPEVEVTEFADGGQLKFTAEVDVRPHLELPDYTSLAVTVDDAEAGDAEIDEQLAGLRDRFAVLSGVDRPVQTGDFVSVDLSATVDGEEISAASATGLSYEVGTASLMPGLDDALVGMGEGGSATFDTELVRGEHVGQTASVNVSVRSVKVKDVPALDDEFAQTASEFDTLEELRADVRGRLERVKKLQQAMQARDRVLEALLETTAVPLPDRLVDSEVQWRQQNLQEQLDAAGMGREEYLESEGSSAEEFDAQIAAGAAQSVKAQFVLDAVAQKEQLGVSEPELSEFVVSRAQRAGVAPDAYAQSLVEGGQLGALMGEVLRGKALAVVLENATVTDASGRPVDLNALRAETDPASAEDDETGVESEPEAGGPADATRTE